MNIVRLYNQNRKKFWRAIIIIASVIILIQVLNYIVGKVSKEKLASNNNANTNTNTVDTTTSKAISNTSGVTGGSVSKETLTNIQEILERFFEYCNSKDLENAYNMLTDECKELIYPNLNLFESNYYNNIFSGKKKNYSFENWRKETYRVTISEDALAMGKLPTSSDSMIDYVTIVDNKLNISSFIGRTEINKEASSKGIAVLINYKDTFMDYEVYNLKIANTTGNTIYLGSTNDSLNICLKDTNDIRYGVYNHELIQSRLILNSKEISTMELKFYSSYVSTKEINRLVFKKVNLNYNGTYNESEAEEVTFDISK